MKTNALGQIPDVNVSSPDVDPVSSSQLISMKAPQPPAKRNFWQGFANVLTNIAEAGKGVAAGFSAGKQAFSPQTTGFTAYPQPPPVQNSNQRYKTIALVAGTGLVVFVIVKLAQK